MEATTKKRPADAPFIGRPRTGRAKLPPRTVRFRPDGSQRVDTFIKKRGLEFSPWAERVVLDEIDRVERSERKS